MKRIDRFKARKSNSNKEYKVLADIINQDPYWDEGITFYPLYRRGTRQKYPTLYSYQIRMYRSWKYNRRTQYKV